MQALRPQLLSWSAEVSSFRRDGCHYSVDARRETLDVLCGEFIQMFWVAANPRDSIKRQNRRLQPDWWDDECYDKMVSRNAAWHCWCRERTSESREIVRSKQLEFHHLVRCKKAFFGMLGSRCRTGFPLPTHASLPGTSAVNLVPFVVAHYQSA